VHYMIILLKVCLRTKRQASSFFVRSLEDNGRYASWLSALCNKITSTVNKRKTLDRVLFAVLLFGFICFITKSSLSHLLERYSPTNLGYFHTPCKRDTGGTIVLFICESVMKYNSLRTPVTLFLVDMFTIKLIYIVTILFWKKVEY